MRTASNEEEDAPNSGKKVRFLDSTDAHQPTEETVEPKLAEVRV